eukprot:Gb_14904 [translate_table: standard]
MCRATVQGWRAFRSYILIKMKTPIDKMPKTSWTTNPWPTFCSSHSRILRMK